MSTKEIPVTTATPTDLFENARYHGSRRALLGSILKEEVPFVEKLPITNNRRIFVLRHGARVDYAFPEFPQKYFDKDGIYKRDDLNLPKTLPHRDNPLENWLKDTPLTNMGCFVSKFMGEALKNAGQTDFDVVLCSPFYRCVQTCDAFLEGMVLRDKIKIKIDAGLCEWGGFGALSGWTSYGDLFTPEQLAGIGFNIDLTYEPTMKYDKSKHNMDESFTGNWRQNEIVLERALENKDVRNILVVAHGFNTYSCTNKFVEHTRKKGMELLPFVGKIPFSAFIGIEERSDGTMWDYVNPLMTMTHAGNYNQTAEFSNRDSPILRKVIKKMLEE